jgi:hypothetical protein
MPDDNGDLAPGGYPLGLIPSPPDERDYRYAAYAPVFATGQLPEEFTLPGIASVDDQGAAQACVACFLGLAKDWQEAQEIGWPVRFSRQFIYSNRNESDHQGPGMVPRMALGRLRNYGVPTEDAWPGLLEYGEETWPDKDALLAAALPHRVATYVRIEQSFIPEVKSAVYTLGPVMYCVPVHANFAPDSEGRMPLPAGNLRGYHAMGIVGWRHGAWLAQNSWGSEWGLGGRCWIPWNYPALEVWAITDAETVRERRVDLTIGSKTMYVNGRPVEMDVAPEIIPPGRTMLPVRFVAEGLGCEVEWLEAERKVRLTRREYPWP